MRPSGTLSVFVKDSSDLNGGDRMLLISKQYVLLLMQLINLSSDKMSTLLSSCYHGDYLRLLLQWQK